MKKSQIFVDLIAEIISFKLVGLEILRVEGWGCRVEGWGLRVKKIGFWGFAARWFFCLFLGNRKWRKLLEKKIRSF